MCEPEDGEACEPCHEGAPEVVADVPAEAYALHFEHCLSCHGADEEEASAAGAAVGEQLPVDAVLRKFRGGAGEGVHLEEVHACHHQGDIVHDGGEGAEADGVDIYVVHMILQPGADEVKRTALGNGAYAEGDAEEVEDDAHADELGVAEVVALHHQHVAVALQVAESLDGPDEGEHGEGAEEGGQLGDVVEGGDEPQSGDADDEQEHLLPCGEVGVVAVEAGEGRIDFHPAVELHADEQVEDAQAGEGRQEETRGVGRGGDGVAHPEHDGGDVADGGEASAQTGGHHDGAGVDDALVVVSDHLRDDAHHQHHGGQVVHVGRDGEGQQRHDPEEDAAVAHAEPVDERVEHAVVVQHLHDGVGGDEEEDDGARLADVARDDVLGHEVLERVGRRFAAGEELPVVRAVHQIDEVLTPEQVDDPCHHAADHRHRGAVDVVHLLRAHQHEADEQHSDNNQCH